MAHTGTENALGNVGFKRNRKGGWWYREPTNRYTIQIIPCDDSDQRYWRIGIANQGPIRWYRNRFASPEDAAFRALHLMNDPEMIDRLTLAMQGGHQNHQARIKRAIKSFMETHYEIW